MRIVLAVIALAQLAACGSEDEAPQRIEPAPAPAPAPRPSAIRLGQCGFVEPGALRGGLQAMSLETRELGEGVPIELDSLQLHPVAGSWFCLLRTLVGDGAFPSPRRPADLGRFTLLREERRTLDGNARDQEEWIHVTDPAWLDEVAARRAAIEEATGDARAALCEEATRARVDPQRVRDEAVTAMRHYVATGQVTVPGAGPSDALEEEVGKIVELCGW